MSYTETFTDVANWELWNGTSFSAVSGAARLQVNSTFTVGVAVQTNDSLGSDEQWVKWQHKSKASTFGIGVVLRAPGTEGGTQYHWRHNTGDDTWRLEQTDNDGGFIGAITGDSAAVTVTTDNWYGIHISDNGTAVSIDFWKFGASDPGDDYTTWGTPTTTASGTPDGSETLITGNYYVGYRTYSGAGASPNYVEFDNFFATGPAAGGGANPKGPLGMPLHGPFGGPVG